MEGILVSLLNERGQEALPENYLALLVELGWQPQLVDL